MGPRVRWGKTFYPGWRIFCFNLFVWISFMLFQIRILLLWILALQLLVWNGVESLFLVKFPCFQPINFLELWLGHQMLLLAHFIIRLYEVAPREYLLVKLARFSFPATNTLLKSLHFIVALACPSLLTKVPSWPFLVWPFIHSSQSKSELVY